MANGIGKKLKKHRNINTYQHKGEFKYEGKATFVMYDDFWDFV